MTSPSSRSPPLVSVIIPAFNAEATLREALSSAMASTYREIEIIVIDDGSTDATAKLVAEFADRDNRVRLHQQDNGGVSAAFNAGLTRARGDYVARLDADDLWHPRKLEKQIALLQLQPEAAFIYAFVRYIDGSGRVLRDAPQQRFPRHAFCRSIYESLMGGNSSALMKRAAVEAAGGYDEALSSWEDLLLQLRILAAHPIAFVPEYLVGYRVRPQSLSADPENMLRSWREARQRIDRILPAAPHFVRRWSNARRCTELAESFAWRGQLHKTAALLAEAASNDPVWVGHYLAHRMLRRLKRNVDGPVQDVDPAPAFLECPPNEQFALGSFDQGLEGTRLQRLESMRKRRLAELDERLASEVGVGV